MRDYKRIQVQLRSTNLTKKFCSKRNDTTEVFGGILTEHSTLSNWSPSQIEYKNNVYVNLEQAYMHIKALENGDNAAAWKIHYTKDPWEIKRIGSKLAVYDNEKWNTIRHGVMHDLVKINSCRTVIWHGNSSKPETGSWVKPVKEVTTLSGLLSLIPMCLIQLYGPQHLSLVKHSKL